MQTVQKNEVSRLQADLPKPLMKRLKLRAVEEETSVTKLVTDAVTKHLSEPPQQQTA